MDLHRTWGTRVFALLALSCSATNGALVDDPESLPPVGWPDAADAGADREMPDLGTDLGLAVVFDGASPQTDQGIASPGGRDQAILTYAGAGGATWMHIVQRGNGDRIRVHTVATNSNVSPPFRSSLSAPISPGACVTSNYGGQIVSNGAGYTGQLRLCYRDRRLFAEHSVTSNGQQSDPQNHGSVSVESDGLYQHTLVFTGTGGTQWVHVLSRRPGSSSVDMHTVSYSSALEPSSRENRLDGIPADACRTTTIEGTMLPSNTPFLTELSYCNRGDHLAIQHVRRQPEPASAEQRHGEIPL